MPRQHPPPGIVPPVPDYAQRLSDVYGILCGTPTSPGIIHTVNQTAENVERLTETVDTLTVSSLKTEQAIRDLAAQVQAAVASGALQADRLKKIEDERDAAKNKVIQILLQGAGAILIRVLVVVVGSSAIVWGYLQSGFAKSSH